MRLDTTVNASLLSFEPVPTLLSRLRAELSGDFDFSRPLCVARAPGRLDVMGGIADYTGSLVCELPLDRAAAVAVQERPDSIVKVVSFNLIDEHKPATFQIPIQKLARDSASARAEFDEPGRKWAAYFLGCFWALHERGYAHLSRPNAPGFNIATYSTVPPGAGISSSAAIEVATMMALREHFQRNAGGAVMDPMQLSELCQSVENQIVGAPCGIMDQVTSCLGQPGQLLRMICQPHDLQEPLEIPQGIRFVGINSGVRHDVGGSAYARTRCAAFMAHKIIVEKMRQIGAAAGREMISDPMRGYLANLDPDAYKRLFRLAIPEQLEGDKFLNQFGPTIDPATKVEPDVNYAVQHAADHHVLEARRVRKFSGYIEEAAAANSPQARGAALDRAGHLMYASHQSYGMDAMLGAPECDLIVKLARARERAGLYGARITGGGSGGTVAILADASPSAEAAIGEIIDDYQAQTGHRAELFSGSSPGAWHLGTVLV